MLCHDLHLDLGPSGSGESCITNSDEKEALLGLHMLAVGQLKHKPALSDLGPHRINGDTGLLKKLPACRIFKIFTGFNPSARSSPVIAAGQSTFRVPEPEQQNPILLVKDDETS